MVQPGMRLVSPVALPCGSVDAPLESEDVALVSLPVQRLPVLSPGLGASSVQDLNSLCASTFPRTGLTSAYPRRYSGPLLLEPSSSLGASGWLPAPLLGRATRGFPVPDVHFSWP
jgi:hypothetical protein